MWVLVLVVDALFLHGTELPLFILFKAAIKQHYRLREGRLKVNLFRVIIIASDIEFLTEI